MSTIYYLLPILLIIYPSNGDLGDDYVSTYDLVKCEASESGVERGDSFILGCETSVPLDRYDQCKVENLQTQSYGLFEWNKYQPVAGVFHNLERDKISFVSKYASEGGCAVKIKQFNPDTDAGDWSITITKRTAYVTSWYPITRSHIFRLAEKITTTTMPTTTTKVRQASPVIPKINTPLAIPLDTSCHSRGVDFRGFGLNTKDTAQSFSNANGCHQHCIITSECRYWAYNHSTRKCWLKSDWAYKGRVTSADLTFGPKYCPTCYTFRSSATHSYLARYTNVPSLQECQGRCKKNSRCNYFFYNVKSLFCGLKSSKPDTRTSTSTILGPRTCETVRWSGWSEWSQCSCGSNNREHRIRECQKDDPSSTRRCPSYEGIADREERPCHVVVCPTVRPPSGSSGAHNNNYSEEGGDDDYTAPIVTTAVAFVVLVIAVILAYVFRSNKEPVTLDRNKKRSSSGSVKMHFTVRPRTSSIKKDANSKPIPILHFREEVRLEKVPEKREFNVLGDEDQRKNVLASSVIIGKKYGLKANGAMNRYSNIVPFDHNRVVLLSGDCDYINASWVRGVGDHDPERTMAAASTLGSGYPGPVTQFIAAQGPLPNTVAQFLQMIVETKAEIVVMLTKVAEAGTDGMLEPKCEQYWPDSDSVMPKNFKNVMVTTLAEEDVADIPHLKKRICQITITGKTPKPLQHQFIQYHMTSWPDFGVPDETGPLVDLVRHVHSHDEGALRRIVVHCSAGVGRTGTFVGLYKIMQRIDEGNIDDIDVYNVVFALREDRMHMVQKKAQYRFLYQCVAEYLRRIDGNNFESEYVYSV